MDIEVLVAREAGTDSEHDRYYAEALRKVYESYKDLNHDQLERFQKLARDCFRQCGATHYHTAACVVLYELLKEDTISESV